MTDPSLENAALRAVHGSMTAIARGDLQLVDAIAAPSFKYDDRRKLMGFEADDREVLEASWRSIAGADFEIEPIAVRGDLLALMRVTIRYPGTDYTGASIVINQIDHDGVGLANIVFDEDDLRAAVRELDTRYEASLDSDRLAVVRLGAQCSDAIHAGDADALRACLAPGAVMTDYRPAGYGRLDRDAYVAASMTLAEVAHDPIGFAEVLEVQTDGMAVRYRGLHIDESGNPLEFLTAAVLIVADGVITQAEAYGGEEYATAVRRLHELTS